MNGEFVKGMYGEILNHLEHDEVAIKKEYAVPLDGVRTFILAISHRHDVKIVMLDYVRSRLIGSRTCLSGNGYHGPPAGSLCGQEAFSYWEIQRTCIYGTPYSHPERRGYYMEYLKRTFLGFSQRENAALPAVRAHTSAFLDREDCGLTSLTILQPLSEPARHQSGHKFPRRHQLVNVDTLKK